ncbi:hypothetical protein KIN20_007697 [Parelaphostrongylus tenuis]|uniref:Uncharacterized protein n=1 Tax=Parelaphostrongylus tenuis TaxID=148309 RepID=A0AAD5QHZ9_PARTN|nr:hypothetical protein KIN20_007697 [Parelaphostrongylus tenuis]
MVGLWSSGTDYPHPVFHFQYMHNLVCIAYGVWLAASRGQYAELLAPSLYVDVARILAVVSTLTIVNQIICIFSIGRELRFWIYASAIASLIIFVMLFIGGIMGLVFDLR